MLRLTLVQRKTMKCSKLCWRFPFRGLLFPAVYGLSSTRVCPVMYTVITQGYIYDPMEV